MSPQALSSSIRAVETRRAALLSVISNSVLTDFHRLRSRRSGHERHIDLHLVVCAEMTVAEAHGLSDRLEQEIAGLFPKAHVMIHTEPCDEAGCPVRRPVGAAHRRDPRCARGSQPPAGGRGQ